MSGQRDGVREALPVKVLEDPVNIRPVPRQHLRVHRHGRCVSSALTRSKVPCLQSVRLPLPLLRQRFQCHQFIFCRWDRKANVIGERPHLVKHSHVLKRHITHPPKKKGWTKIKNAMDKVAPC